MKNEAKKRECVISNYFQAQHAEVNNPRDQRISFKHSIENLNWRVDFTIALLYRSVQYHHACSDREAEAARNSKNKCI
jgi:hypothetical protein